jgi:hypothetical protein
VIFCVDLTLAIRFLRSLRLGIRRLHHTGGWIPAFLISEEEPWDP